MTDLEKNKVSALRDGGLSYREIAQATGISLSTIKMHFNRKTPGGSSRVCQQCRKPLGKDAPPRKKFCSDRCRWRYWTAHPEKLGNAVEHRYRCANCGKAFFANKAAVYCSASCYHLSRRKAGDANG